jgi:hypothetical protein
MARYLLGANALIDMCYEGTPVALWLATVKPHEIRLSVISVATARDVIAREAKNLAELGRLRQAFEPRLVALINEGALTLPFGSREAEEWQKWRNHDSLHAEMNGQLITVGHDTRMVIATAFANGLELVEPAEAYHDELVDNGLTVHSL